MSQLHKIASYKLMESLFFYIQTFAKLTYKFCISGGIYLKLKGLMFVWLLTELGLCDGMEIAVADVTSPSTMLFKIRIQS